MLEARVSAALAWLEVVGDEIFEWKDEWEYGPYKGDRGGGGPLWNGKHGFCKERFKFWRERFGKIAREGEVKRDVLDQEVTRAAAGRAEAITLRIESGERV